MVLQTYRCNGPSKGSFGDVHLLDFGGARFLWCDSMQEIVILDDSSIFEASVQYIHGQVCKLTPTLVLWISKQRVSPHGLSCESLTFQFPDAVP